MQGVAAFAFMASALAAWAAVDGQKAKPPRALPPKWDQRARGAFFEDVDQALVGPRPAYGTGASQPRMVAGANPSDGGSSGGVFAWSKIISPETVEDEIKNLNKQVDEIVTTPQKYAAGDYRVAQRYFSTLAVMFAVAAEYDADVRWKDRAAGARETFALAGFGSRVGSVQAYNQAKLAKQDLAELVRGGSIASRSDQNKAEWGKVAYRPPLMQRMREAHEERLQPLTANANQFQGALEDILHEAEVVAALAEAITRDGFEFSDDDDYLGHCRSLKKASLDVVDAVRLKNADAARKAVGEMAKSCSACHEGYRS
jgi:hypothetical protein